LINQRFKPLGVHHELLPEGYFQYLAVNLPDSTERVNLRHRSSPGQEVNARLAHNYFNIFGHMFQKLGPDLFNHIVVLEDDLLPAPDFLQFFESGAQLMAEDDSVFTVSAWNDNGHHGYVSDETQMLRGEHFMALGWLLSRRVYLQVIEIFIILNNKINNDNDNKSI
jgi:hypothetical protein